MRRVVITGSEAISAFGIGEDKLWKCLVSGVNGIREIEQFDASSLPIKIAGDVPTIQYSSYLGDDSDLVQPIPESRSAQFSVLAINNALQKSGLDYHSWLDPERVGLFLADRETSVSWYIEETAPLYVKSLDSEGRVRNKVFFELMKGADALAKYKNMDGDKPAIVAQSRFGVEGPNVSIGTACASSNDAIGQAALQIRAGNIDVAIAGGVFDLDLMGMIGFTRLEALTANPDPNTACRPFDKERDGFVMASGCGVLILEELESARRRGAKILAEIGGYGNCCDAYRATDPHPKAEGAFRAIGAALKEAQIDPCDIGYVAAHGTSTKLNDRTETIAIKRALGEHARRVKVSASKSMIGHTIMAAGAIQAIVAIHTLSYGVAHPTRNLQVADPECDLNYVPIVADEVHTNAVLSNSFGFGGQNSSIIFKRYAGR